MKISKELIIAINASINAGISVMRIYDSINHDVEYKKDNSPLTQADILSNDIICNELNKTNTPIISEENKSISYDLRKNWTKFWLVDPLDGTKEFLNKNGEFTVNIALIVNSKAYLGVIYIPFTKTLYYSEKGFGSYKVVLKNHVFTGHDDNNKISYNKLKVKNNILVSRSHLTKNALSFIDENPDMNLVKIGSSIKLCLLAEGEGKVYPRFAPIMEWDIAAGIIILDEAREYKSKDISFNTKSLTLEIDLFK